MLPGIEQSIDLNVLDAPVAASLLLRWPGLTRVTVEGNAVVQLRAALGASLLPAAIDEAVIESSDEATTGATFTLTDDVMGAIEPLLALDDWSIFHFHLHTEHEWLVEGYDWGEGCCPLRVSAHLPDLARALIDAGAAKPWAGSGR